MLDIYHMFEDLNDCVKKSSPYRSLWLSSIANATYRFAKDDVERVRARLIAQKNTNAEKLASDGRYLKSQTDVRRILATSEQFIKSVSGIVDSLAKIGGTFTRDILSFMPKLESKAKLALDYPDDYVQIIQIGERNGSPIYRHLRGTNCSESFFRPVQRTELYNCAPEIMHGVMLLLMSQRSQIISKTVLNQDLVIVNDFELKNSVIKLQRTLPPELGYHVLDECNYVEPISSEDYLSSFVRPLNSRVSAVMDDRDAGFHI